MKQLLITTGFVTSLIALCIVCGILTYVPDREIRAALATILFVIKWGVIGVVAIILFALAVVTIIGLYLAGCYAYNNALAWWHSRRIKAAEVTKAERDANMVITVAPAGSQVYTHAAPEMKERYSIIPNHLQPVATNGAYVEPTPDDIGRWQFYQLSQSISRGSAGEAVQQIQQEPLLLEPPLPNYVDLADHCNGTTSLRNIFLGVGKFPDGQVRPVREPLSSLIHVRVGGASGFGKSTKMKSLAYQVLNAREAPNVVMLDAQAVTFTAFYTYDNLLYPISSDIGEIRRILKELYDEVHRRDELFSRWSGVDSIEVYNHIPDVERLPIIPILFDEFGLVADDKEIIRYSTKLAQAGRKCGMFIIAGAQFWNSDAIASALKANMSTTVAFHTTSKSQSRVLIDDSAAVDLTQPGRAYCIFSGQAGLVEIQTPDVSNVLNEEPQLIDIRSQAIRAMPEPEPDELEQQIIDAAERGLSDAKICYEVWGYKSSNKYPEIRETLKKYNVQRASDA